MLACLCAHSPLLIMMSRVQKPLFLLMLVLVLLQQAEADNIALEGDRDRSENVINTLEADGKIGLRVRQGYQVPWSIRALLHPLVLVRSIASQLLDMQPRY